MANVILLRTPSHDSTDLYEETFKSFGYNALSVPVLETFLTNLDDLNRILRTSPCPTTEGYAGVVVTSARACGAWKVVVSDIMADTSYTQKSPVESWSSLPFYVAGNTTAGALRAIRDVHGDSHLTPMDIRGASESGTGERLAHFVLEDLRKKEKILKPKMLYLTGDKNRDTIPNILREHSVELESLKVYETQGSSNFAKHLEVAVKGANPALDNWWIVFFAPSAAELVLPTLRKYFDFCSSDRPSEPPHAVRVAAIGPTTAAFLQNDMNLYVDVVAPKPTPSDVVDAVVGYDRVKILRRSQGPPSSQLEAHQ